MDRFTDPINRGMVGGLLGLPAEMANMLRNGGRSVGNLANKLAGVNAPPAPMVENPVYGQEWWGNKMQKAGYVSPNRNKLAEFGAGLLDPGSVMTDVPMLAKGLFGLGDPATISAVGGLLGGVNVFPKRDFSWVGSDQIEAAKQISEAAKNSKGKKLGLRVIPPESGSFSPGDVLPSSYKWKNGDWTEKQLDGVSTAKILSPDVDSVLEALHSLGALGKRSKNGYYFGSDVALVAGDSSKKGQDYGESVIKNGVVLDVWKKQDKGFYPIQSKPLK
jgi:hypothetical protein